MELLDAKYQGKKSLYTWKSVYISGRENTNIEPTPPNSEDIAILMYTSGSTGNPKVRFPSGHRNLMKTYHKRRIENFFGLFPRNYLKTDRK